MVKYQRAEINSDGRTEKPEWRLLTSIYPEDVNRLQKFELADAECDTIESGVRILRLEFEDSSDFFGRITIYDLQVEGRTVVTWTLKTKTQVNILNCSVRLYWPKVVKGTPKGKKVTGDHSYLLQSSETYITRSSFTGRMYVVRVTRMCEYLCSTYELRCTFYVKTTVEVIVENFRSSRLVLALLTAKPEWLCPQEFSRSDTKHLALHGRQHPLAKTKTSKGRSWS